VSASASGATTAVPLDSARLQALQGAVTKIASQTSGSAITGAIDGAIADGFSDDGGALITQTGGGVHFNFSAEPNQAALHDGSSAFDAVMSARASVEPESGPWNGLGGQGSLAQPWANSGRVNDTYGALGYANNPMPTKAPPSAMVPPKDWQVWAEVQGTGWNTNVSNGDIVGTQTNALLGVTRRLTPDLLIGAFGGYETFGYGSNTLNGRLDGDGWTGGGYVGWRIWPGLRFGAAVARSGIGYDGVSGTASATFPGNRWVASTGLTGTYTMARLLIEPSAKVHVLWEHDNQYLDSLGTVQNAIDFSTGRASGGAQVTYPWYADAWVAIAPYVGAYADYYFNNNGGVPLLLPTQFVQGFAGRVTAGLAYNINNGPKLSVGGELGGIGNDFLTWSARGRVSWPF
jgi:hypothetical protein